MATRPTWNTKVLKSISRMMIRLNRMAMSWILEREEGRKNSDYHQWYEWSPLSQISELKLSHEEDQLDGRLVSQQLAERVDEQVEGEQAELDQQHQGVVAGLERLRSKGLAPGRTVVPRRIQGCAAPAPTHYIEGSVAPTTVLSVSVCAAQKLRLGGLVRGDEVWPRQRQGSIPLLVGIIWLTREKLRSVPDQNDGPLSGSAAWTSAFWSRLIFTAPTWMGVSTEQRQSSAGFYDASVSRNSEEENRRSTLVLEKINTFTCHFNSPFEALKPTSHTREADSDDTKNLTFGNGKLTDWTFQVHSKHIHSHTTITILYTGPFTGDTASAPACRLLGSNTDPLNYGWRLWLTNKW